MLVAILQELFIIILDIEKGAMFKFEGINRYSTIWKDPCCPNREHWVIWFSIQQLKGARLIIT